MSVLLDREIDWLVLRQGRYEALPKDAAGIYRSEVFPGLWLDADAMMAGDLARCWTLCWRVWQAPSMLSGPNT